MSEFFNWNTLVTVAGATAACAYITQFLKKIDFISKLNTQLVSYCVALVVLFPATYFTGSLTIETACMIPLNAIIVAFSANGAYDSVKSTVDASSKAATALINSVTSTIETITKQVETLTTVITGKTNSVSDTTTNKSDAVVETLDEDTTKTV